LPAKILIMSTFFYLVINMSEYTLIAVSKQHRIIFIGVIAILIGAVVNYLFIKVLKQGLNGAAISTVITYFIYSTILLFTSYRNYSRRVFEQLKFFLRIYFPLIWSVAGLVFISRKFQLVTGVLGRDLFYTLSASICFLITVSPLIYWVNKRTNILKLIFAPKTIFEKNGY